MLPSIASRVKLSPYINMPSKKGSCCSCLENNVVGLNPFEKSAQGQKKGSFPQAKTGKKHADHL